MVSVATVINYCTNDYRFIGRCIEEVKHFSKEIWIPVCDHFFNGMAENRALLDRTYAEHPDCRFIEFAYSTQKLYDPYLRITAEDEDWPRIWHSTARALALQAISPDIDWILFLDADEIVEGKRFATWLKNFDLSAWSALRLSCYYYVLKPDYRADQLQSLSLFIHRSAIHPQSHFHRDERYALYKYAAGNKKQEVRGSDGKPLIHHYSWVRPEAECLQKATTWGHRADEDWSQVIAQAFSSYQGQKLFGTQLCFERIKELPYFDPLQVPIPSDLAILSSSFAHVEKVTPEKVFRRQLEQSLNSTTVS